MLCCSRYCLLDAAFSVILAASSPFKLQVPCMLPTILKSPCADAKHPSCSDASVHHTYLAPCNQHISRLVCCTQHSSQPGEAARQTCIYTMLEPKCHDVWNPASTLQDHAVLGLCRLREAELMFQEDMVADADRLLRTVVRKNPTYAGKACTLIHATIISITILTLIPIIFYAFQHRLGAFDDSLCLPHACSISM